MPTLILLRHGQSQWNLENRFTGWVDVPLTELGVAEAKAAGDRLAAAGLLPDVVHTSLQTRAIRTAELSLAALDRSWIPVTRSWRLNERHYGGLQGLNKAETAAQHGDEQVRVWRRSYDTPPPSLDAEATKAQLADPRYAALPPDSIPLGECLADVVRRVLPWWEDNAAPVLRAGQTLLVAAHGNSLRALAKHLEGIGDADIMNLEIATGTPKVYDLDSELRVRNVKDLT